MDVDLFNIAKHARKYVRQRLTPNEVSTRELALAYLIGGAGGFVLMLAVVCTVLFSVRAVAFWFVLPPEIWLRSLLHSYWISIFIYVPIAFVFGCCSGLYLMGCLLWNRD